MDGVQTYGVALEFTEKVLASSPADPEVYKAFIETKKPVVQVEDETATLENANKMELAGWSVFHKDEVGLFLYDYHIRGFLKESAMAITGGTKDGGIGAIRSKIDRWVFVAPRRIYFHRTDGSPIGEPDSVLERPCRVMTMQGPRVALKRSDYIEAGAGLRFEIDILPLGGKQITEATLRKWFDYGQYVGISEWRNGSFGRFTYTLEKVGVETPMVCRVVR